MQQTVSYPQSRMTGFHLHPLCAWPVREPHLAAVINNYVTSCGGLLFMQTITDIQTLTRQMFGITNKAAMITVGL